WEEEDIACISFCDEATFEIGLDPTPSHVRGKPGHSYETRYLKPTFKSRKETVSVFGMISLDFKGPLVIL
ncbi:hypothetical protein K469DRAFT_525960, partial [Zopfia rhizophila CBS 207.26]